MLSTEGERAGIELFVGMHQLCAELATGSRRSLPEPRANVGVGRVDELGKSYGINLMTRA